MFRRVFMCFDHREDLQFRRLLPAWNTLSRFEFEFDDRSPAIDLNSAAAPLIQDALSRRMKESDILLVVIGRHSADNPWVEWEIRRAAQPDIRLKLVAVKLDPAFSTPAGLLGQKVSFASDFNLASIEAALLVADQPPTSSTA